MTADWFDTNSNTARGADESKHLCLAATAVWLCSRGNDQDNQNPCVTGGSVGSATVSGSISTDNIAAEWGLYKARYCTRKRATAWSPGETVTAFENFRLKIRSLNDDNNTQESGLDTCPGYSSASGSVGCFKYGTDMLNGGNDTMWMKHLLLVNAHADAGAEKQAQAQVLAAHLTKQLRLVHGQMRAGMATGSTARNNTITHGEGADAGKDSTDTQTEGVRT
ncbi:Trypanosomal VSG domain [Trypanosoma vivax]|nr:Trypanosomal VSG domain [Trypanosoma vivax]